MIRIVAVIAFSVSLLFGCSRKETAPAKSIPQNVILLTLDTVRSDYLQLYNPSGAATPNLNKIASKSFVFTHAVAQVPYTLPSHSTLFTGMFPAKHGVRENAGAVLPDEMLTIAEAFKAAGFRTAGFAGAIVLSASTGIAQGFEYYDDSFSRRDLLTQDLSGIQRNADEVLQSFAAWISREKPSRYFAFLHFYDPHDPYQPPARFAPANATIHELYKGELSYVDSVIGNLHQLLESNSMLQNTMLVIAGDHGEMLGEHGEKTHGYFIYQSALRVPLLISVPGMNRRKDIHSPVMLANVFATIMDLMNLEQPETLQAASLVPLMESEATQTKAAYSESYTASKYFGAAPLIGIQDGSFHYIDSPKPELYDLRNDAASKSNLITQQSAVASRLKNELQKMVPLQEKDVVVSRDVTTEQEEQLAALGYISGGASEIVPGRDSKDFIGSWNQLNQLNTALRENRYDEALKLVIILKKNVSGSYLDIFEARALSGNGKASEATKILRSVLKTDPANLSAAAVLAPILEKSGSLNEAAHLYTEIAKRQNSPYALENYAKQMIRMKKEDELLRYLKSLKAAGILDDRFARSAGEIYMNLRQLTEATKYLTRAIELNPESSEATVLLAMVLDAQNRTSEALALLEGGAGKFRDADYYLQLGLIYHRTGQLMLEKQMFETMMKEHPDDSRGYFYYARLMLDQGADPRSVIEIARKGLSLNPTKEFQAFGYYLLADSFEALGRKQESKHYLSLAEKAFE